MGTGLVCDDVDGDLTGSVPAKQLGENIGCIAE